MKLLLARSVFASSSLNKIQDNERYFTSKAAQSFVIKTIKLGIKDKLASTLFNHSCTKNGVPKLHK